MVTGFLLSHGKKHDVRSNVILSRDWASNVYVSYVCMRVFFMRACMYAYLLFDCCVFVQSRSDQTCEIEYAASLQRKTGRSRHIDKRPHNELVDASYLVRVCLARTCVQQKCRLQTYTDHPVQVSVHAVELAPHLRNL